MIKQLRFYLPLLIIAALISCSKKQAPEGSGLQFTDTATLHKINNAKSPVYGSSSKQPLSVDLSTKMPPPGNQGAQNSCVGWSIAYGMKSYQEKSARNWDVANGNEINKEHVFSPAYIYNQVNHGEDKGSKFVDAFNVVQSKGVASLQTDPYDDADYLSKPNDAADNEAKNFKIAWAKTIDPKDLEGIKSYLSKGYPVIIAISFDEAFGNPNGDAVVSSMKVDDKAMGHAMLIVGYDESKKCFRIMNSWGTAWRDGGFCWMTYDAFKQCIRECWIAKDMEDKKEIKKEDENPVDEQNPIVDEVLSGLQIKNVADDPQGSDGSGKSLQIKGTVKFDNDFGDAARIVVFFNYPDGKPVLASNDSYSYVNGEAIGYTEQIDIKNYNEEVKDFNISIPYSALKIEKDKGTTVYATPILFIDDFDATDGKPYDFKISGE